MMLIRRNQKPAARGEPRQRREYRNQSKPNKIFLVTGYWHLVSNELGYYWW